jgi:DNA-directed RNA polymerase subunit RPC12/RpoP
MSILSLIICTIVLYGDTGGFAWFWGILGFIGVISSYLYFVSTYKSKSDRVIDSFALFVILSTTIGYSILIYKNISDNPIDLLQWAHFFLFYLSIILSTNFFISRSFLSDEIGKKFAENPQFEEIIDQKDEKLDLDNKPTISSQFDQNYPHISKTQNKAFLCEACQTDFHLPISTAEWMQERNPIYCPYCGSKIQWYNVVDFDPEWLLNEHQDLVNKIDVLKHNQRKIISDVETSPNTIDET